MPDTMVTSGVVGGGNDNSQDDSSSTGAKDDEDEDDDDEEKLEGMDPEKLKAFNVSAATMIMTLYLLKKLLLHNCKKNF